VKGEKYDLTGNQKLTLVGTMQTNCLVPEAATNPNNLTKAAR
jgi:hypothetical protein